jgi:pyridoxamine 5'-phosphate oxidase
MDTHDLMNRVAAILDAHKTGILATTDEEGRPRVRWLTPGMLRDRFGAIYALSAPRFAKVAQLRAHPEVEWMFQNPALSEIVTVRGKMNVVDNPSLRAEALEQIGPRLHVFWKLARDERDLAVLETIVEEATHYLPMEGRKTVVRFKR